MSQCLEYKDHKLAEAPLTVIDLAGRIEESLAAVAKIATAAESEHVAILMENVEYINSKGCDELLTLQSEVEKRGFRMYVVNPVGGVETVMLHLGCHIFMRIKKSLDDVILEIKGISEES